MFLTVCKTIRFLHGKNILHRDIKPENILLDQDMNPVFCDFGWSIQLDYNESRDTFCGTLEYIAPEIFKGDQYNKPADIWSLGILIYEMMHGYSPFKGKNYRDVSVKVMKGAVVIDESLSSRLHRLIKAILKPMPEDRPSIDYIIDETTAIIQSNEIYCLKAKEKVQKSGSSVLDNAKEKIVVFAGGDGSPISLARTVNVISGPPKKSSSPNFLKSAFSNFKASKLADSNKDLTQPDSKQGPPIDLSSVLNRNRRGEPAKESSELKAAKRPLMITKASSGNNLLKNRNPNLLSNSNSDKKLSDSHSSRRKKVKVFVSSGTGDDRTNTEFEGSWLNSTEFKDPGCLHRKESTGTDLESKVPAKKESSTFNTLKNNSRIKFSQDSTNRKLSNSKENKFSFMKNGNIAGSSSSLKSNQVNSQSKQALNNKQQKVQGKPQSHRAIEEKGKFTGKLSESHKHLVSTPKDKGDKDYFFASMVYLQPKVDMAEKDKDKASLILNKISKKISTTNKGSVDVKGSAVKYGIQQPQLSTSPRNDLTGFGKELFKSKAKSFRSSNSIYSFAAVANQDKK